MKAVMNLKKHILVTALLSLRGKHAMTVCGGGDFLHDNSPSIFSVEYLSTF